MSALGRATKSLEINCINDAVLPQPPADTISCLSWSPVSNFLAVSSWDNSVRVYEIDAVSGQGQGRAMYSHDAPALSVCWWVDGTKIISGGADNQVKSYDTATGQATTIGTHQAPVIGVKLVNVGQAMVASVSYDCTLKYWDLMSNQPVATVQLPAKPTAVCTGNKSLFISMVNNQIAFIDLNNPGLISRTENSLLKKTLTTIACQTDGEGFSVGSVEGRCAMQYINPSKTGSNFSFKCHRVSQGTAAKPADDVYSVNAMDFHPTYNTLATAGSDGTFHIWDKDNRHRLSFAKQQSMPVTALSFNAQGNLVAYALGYDWTKGYAHNKLGPPVVKVHKLEDWEMKQKDRR